MTQVGKKPTEPKPTGTDWERVKREAAQDAPVSFDPAADADRELYNLNDDAAVSADMDLRLSEALGTTPGHWLALQTQRNW